MVNDEENTVLESIPLELDNDVILRLALQAHEKDITLNQHIINILMEEVERLQNEE